MLQVIHKYYRSVLGTFFIFIIGLSMLFFGVDFGARPQESYALKINDTEVDFSQFEQRKQEKMAQLFQNLGANYQQFAAQLLEGMNQRIIDELIDETLLQETARQEGFAPGKNFIKKLVQQFFPKGTSTAQAADFLRRIGSNDRAFEARLANETLAMQIRGLLKQISAAPPKALVRALYEQQERQYSINIASLKPEDLSEKVEAPTEDELNEFYEENIIDYELTPRVRLSYAEVRSESFKKEVEVLDEDIELYYVDNEREFRTPEEVKIREIVLNLNASDIAAKVGTESLADELFERVQSGESIEQLALEYSDDSRKGKTSAWITKGSQGEEFDGEFFGEGIEAGKQALIATSSKIRITELVEKKEAGMKPLEKVQGEIKEKITAQEAPIYAAERAREIFDSWVTSDEDLATIATKNQLSVQKIAELTPLEDTTEENRALIREALEVPGEEKLLVDNGESLALVFVDEFQDTDTPPLEAIKDKVTNDMKKLRAIELAEAKAIEIQQAETSLSEESLKELGATFETVEKKKGTELLSLPFTSLEVKQAVLSRTEPGRVGEIPFEVNNAHYILEITEVVEADPEGFEKQAEQIEKQSSQRLALLLEQGLLSHLKANNDIDVHPSAFER